MKDLVLVPGWGFDAGVWRTLTLRLAGRCRLHLVALPRRLDEPPPAAIPSGATVCGWSLGAMAALAWARHEPRRIARLALVGATPRFVQAPDWPDAQPPALLEGFATAVAADPRAALRRFAALMNQGDLEARRLTRELAALLDEGVPPAAALADGLAALRDTDLRAAIADIAQPALVLHGDRDLLMPLAAGRWLAAHLPAARLEVFAGCAHAPFLSQPDRFAEALLAFLDE